MKFPRANRNPAGKTKDGRICRLAPAVKIGYDLRDRRRHIAGALNVRGLQERLIGHFAVFGRRQRRGRAGGVEPYGRRVEIDSDGYVAAVDAAVGIRNAGEKEQTGESRHAEAAQQQPGPRFPANPADGPFAHEANLCVRASGSFNKNQVLWSGGQQI